jgi:Domain of unknown function DUF11
MNHWTRLVSSTLAVLTCAFALVFGVASAVADPPPPPPPPLDNPNPLAGSKFEGGDAGAASMTTAQTPNVISNFDWNSHGALTLFTLRDPQTDDPSTPNIVEGDSAFGGGNKETEPDNWFYSPQLDGVNPSKDNVFAAWAIPEDEGAGGNFLNLAFYREDPNGDTFLTFELHQAPADDPATQNINEGVTWTNSQNTTIPCRQTGDVLVSYEVTPGGPTPVEVKLYKWTSTPGQIHDVVKNGVTYHCGGFGTFAEEDLGPTAAEAAMNFASDINNALDPDPSDGNPAPSTIDKGKFGEASINLALALGNLGNACFNFGSWELHSRSSVAIDSQLQDTLGPLPILLRNCTIEVKKTLSPSNDPGKFNLQVDGTTKASDVGDGGDTGPVVVAAGNNHSVGETQGTSTLLSNYTTTYSCVDNGDTANAVTGSATTVSNIVVGTGDNWVCTFTNTRKTGKLEVVKDLQPDSDPGRFDLQIDGNTEKSDAGDGGTTGEKTVGTGVHTVGEVAGSVGDPADYQKSIVCKDQNGTGTTVASVGPDNAGPLNVTVNFGDDIVCTVTNVRETGKIEVVKDLQPANDSGRFNLQVDGVTKKADAADGDTTGEVTVNTGTHNVGEIAGSSGLLSDYQKSIECKDQNGTGSVVASVGADSAGPLNVTVHYQDDIVCTVTNVRETGQLEVVKDLQPDSDPGRFDLQIDGNTEKTDAGDGGTTGEKTVNTGVHTVGEIAGSVGDPADYQKSIVCKDQNGTGTTVASVAPDSAGPLNVTVGYQDDIVCTVTNVRETGKIEVVKDLQPANDPGRFDLQVDGSTEKSDAGDGGTTGEVTVNTGTHNVGEIAGSVGALANYQKSIECKDQNGNGSVVATTNVPDDAGPLNVTVHYQDDIVCTVTNVRETGQLEVVKDLQPDSDPGRFDLQIDGNTEKSDAGDGGTTGEKTVGTGVHTVGEVAGSVGDPADYQKSIVCKDQNGTGSTVASVGADNAGTLNVTVNFGDDIVCTITNVRETGRLELRKHVVPDTDNGKFNLSITRGQTTIATATDVGDGGTTGKQTVNSNLTYHLDESAGTGTDLSDYSQSIACEDDSGESPAPVTATAAQGAGWDVHVDSGQDVVCTITNTLIPIVVAIDKQGPDLAHDGDVITYSIKVTNPGTHPLQNVKVTDAIKGTSHGCDGGADPTFTGGDTNSDNRLDPTETWTYTCKYTVQHGDEDATHHIVNVATVTATDGSGHSAGPVDDDATTLIIHPAIAIDKTGPATALAGDKVGYVLTVTNPGDTSLADPTVKVSDAQCNGDPVTLIGKGGDPSPDTLDPGDVWTYSCSVRTAVGDTAIHNVATVTGCDRLDKCVNAQDTADTTLTQPEQLVLPERVTPGTARLLGPTGCLAKAFNARVRGSKIATVTFVLDGKKVKTLTKPDRKGIFQLRVNPAKMKTGVHRLVVNVTFEANSGTRPRTLRLSFQRCAKKLAPPRFTG